MSVLTVRQSEYGDASNGGLSATHTQVTLVGPEGDGTEPTESAPAVEVAWTTPTYKVVRPVASPGEGTPWMASGATVTFPDGSTLPLHDRTETWAQYQALST